MKAAVSLRSYLRDAPPAQCTHYDAGDTVVCRAKGAARNNFPLLCSVSAVALETDGEAHRFPPDRNKEVCDWCVFAETRLHGCFIELKGSDFVHALEQLASTMTYMRMSYGIVPQRAIAVLSGAHPSNARPGKANAKAKFKRKFPDVIVCERSSGQAKPEDVLR